MFSPRSDRRLLSASGFVSNIDTKRPISSIFASDRLLPSVYVHVHVHVLCCKSSATVHAMYMLIKIRLLLNRHGCRKDDGSDCTINLKAQTRARCSLCSFHFIKYSCYPALCRRCHSESGLVSCAVSICMSGCSLFSALLAAWPDFALRLPPVAPPVPASSVFFVEMSL